MSHYFRGQGFDVDCAGDAESARLLVTERPYSLAIVDVHLAGRAGSDGLDLAEWIRVEQPGIGVIVMTALETAETVQRASLLGSFVRKPARLAHVAQIANGLLGRATV